MLDFGASRCSVVIIANAGGLGCGYDHRVIRMKQNEIRGKLLGLREGKAEGLFVGRDLGGKEDGGGFAPSWLCRPWEPP